MLETTYDYAVIRVVPRVERSEFINAGVILFARSQRFLDARVSLDRERLFALFPDAPMGEIEEYLALIPKICAGGTAAGPIGQLPQPARWHWLVAPRSTIIQISEVHSGLCADPAAEIEHLMQSLVA